MPRIVGVDIPKQKTVEIALTSIYGIGRKLAGDIIKKIGIKPGMRARDLTEDEVGKIGSMIQKEYQVEGDLRRERTQNIKRLMNIGCYRGLRHRRGLPVRGQRTHTNARTRKGPGQTVGAKRKKKGLR
ncbi:MAG: 30S ribosomal protein S13 [Candidatus Euphemobacter frigidus]|nr:30S ribosomal protein S13 [Candidatus Euphemobacter frigidus]MDP8276181.1 30S ribosomal protein S13 [Candidatus Euphemobacter frigidus]